MIQCPTIAIDYTPAYEQGGGIGRLTRELIAALARLEDDAAYRLFVMGAGRKPLPPLPGERFTWRPTPITPKWWARAWGRARLPLPVELVAGRFDLYHATDFLLPPTLPGARTLLTVHDLSYARVPESASPRLRAYLNSVVPRSARRAGHILADSQATKDDLVALYGLPPDNITVILSGVDSHFQRVTDEAAWSAVRARYQLGPRPYIFAVGTVQPRKNYIRLMQALGRLRAGGLDVMLVIAGGKGWLDDPIYRALDDLKLREHVHLIGFADDADLPTLYSTARVTAFPSLYEGFGLPILESMACGTPVVTANLSSMPEAAGEAALLIDPLDVEALAGALGRLLTDDALHADLVARGLAQARRFTWERAARQLQGVYRTQSIK
jgi:glycosyltransferase involved in cell wall biosynthesis